MSKQLVASISNLVARKSRTKRACKRNELQVDNDNNNLLNILSTTFNVKEMYVFNNIIETPFPSHLACPNVVLGFYNEGKY